jgi:hypothetical protein
LNIFFGKAKDNQIEFSNKKALSDYLSTVEGKGLWIRIERMTGQRSDTQNRFYWAYIRVIANETGHSDQELHELFKRLFIPPQWKTILGREVKLPGSTTNLSKSDFGEYLDRIAAETGIPVPDSNIAQAL